MSELDDLVESILADFLADNSLTAKELESSGGPVVQAVITAVADDLKKECKKNSSKILRASRRDVAGFEVRNLRRWRKAFNLVELIWHIVAEASEKFDAEFRPTAVVEKDFIFESLIHLNARSLLVGNEAICLMKGGFPDGALSRWRTLHEISVIASFISKNDNETAHRYLASFDFQALKAAKQVDEYAGRGNLDPFSAEEILALEQRCKALTARLGHGLGDDYGWASLALSKKKPNIFDLEVATGLDHWRPRFKWASAHTHGGHRPVGSLLGVSESESEVHLIGQSNSGMVDPLQMVAMSLCNVASALLLSRPNMDNLICAKVLIGLSDEVGPTAIEIEKRTLEAARSKGRAVE